MRRWLFDEPLVAAEDFLTAANILALARSVAMNEKSLKPVIQNRAQVIEAARTTHDRLVPHIEKLKTAPDYQPQTSPSAALSASTKVTGSAGCRC